MPDDNPAAREPAYGRADLARMTVRELVDLAAQAVTCAFTSSQYAPVLDRIVTEVERRLQPAARGLAGPPWEYTFTVWPDETSPRMKACPAVFELFKMLLRRVGMEFTERGFNDFREELAKVGLTLREIERVPVYQPEPIL